jgi:hypothetical protein
LTNLVAQIDSGSKVNNNSPPQFKSPCNDFERTLNLYYSSAIIKGTMLKTFTLFSFPIWGFFVISSATEQKILSGSANSPLHDDFSRIVNETLQLWHVPGVSIAVVDGDVTWSEVSWVDFFLDSVCMYLLSMRMSKTITRVTYRDTELLSSQIRRSHPQHYFMLEVQRKRSLQQQCRSSWTTTRSIHKSNGKRQFQS